MMTPKEKIERIDEMFRKINDLVREKKRGQNKIVKVITAMLIFSIVALSITFGLKIKNEKLSGNKGENSGKVTGAKKEVREGEGEEERLKNEEGERISCVLKVPFDPEIIKIAFENNIGDINIKLETKHSVNKVSFFIGDFTSIEDAMIVSARLNEKGIPHKIEKEQERWRVYLQINVKGMNEISLKEKITNEDIDELKERASKIVGEIVELKVEKKDEMIPVAIFKIEDKNKCMELYKRMRELGKEVEREILIISSLPGQI